ncbi:beta-ketoacyl-[acyl-carrier-protein] synthase family protein [Gorillibacterium sp. sgz500922]|uniref:beta-ketoacyl-[acyl-carrier-protein] synthase family protein n=1 Tax=Gorillibacterium sp. sgz500922 TaxID=3446694 RepID=UPI003F67A733
MMSERVVITGIGLVGPCGNSTAAFWQGLLEGDGHFTPLPRSAEGRFAPRPAGQVTGIEPERHFPRRFLNKCARFSVLSLLAAKEALEDAGLADDTLRTDRVGIFVGNNSGGWEQAHQGLQTLHTEGPGFVSPFLASNWFPAAAQGHLSLAYGIKGLSKTLIADRASGLVAIAAAAKAIRKGAVDIALAGGVETPLDEWGLAFYESSGLLCAAGAEEARYAPYQAGRSGLLLGEGAAYLVLESETSARARGMLEKAKGSIQGFGMTNAGAQAPSAETSIRQGARAIELALGQSDAKPDELGYVSLEGAASVEEDALECAALRRVLGDGARRPVAGCPKAAFGHTVGAAGAFDVALAAMAMQEAVIPGIAGMREADAECGLSFADAAPREARADASLVLARGSGGIAAALVVGRKCS